MFEILRYGVVQLFEGMRYGIEQLFEGLRCGLLQFVEELRYKPECCGFGFIVIILPAAI